MLTSEQRIKMIQERISAALKPAQLDVIDDSQQHIGHPGAASGGGHFTVIIKAECFSEKSLVACHRMVYDALGDAMEHEIHALSIKIAK